MNTQPRRLGMNAKQMLDLWKHGGMTDAELLAQLEKVRTRGTIAAGRFVGYDYDAQRWISSHGATV